MTEMTTYAPGTPCWVDLGSPDIDASIDFYGALFGWDVPESENAEQTGGYRLATLRGNSTGGMMPLMQEGQPPAWMTYVSVEDADAAAAAVRELEKAAPRIAHRVTAGRGPVAGAARSPGAAAPADTAR